MTDPAERKRWRIGRPSPAMVVALLALFVALSGTAVAAGVVPLAKHALTANTATTAITAKNALKLGGLTAAAGRRARHAARRSTQDGALDPQRRQRPGVHDHLRRR